MASISSLLLVGLALLHVGTSFYMGRDAERHITREKSDYEKEIRALEKRLPACKEQFEACRGVPRCCGDLVCYWENGASALKDGECVTCVDRTLTCQRDSQCCENSVCQKSNPAKIDGVCELRKTTGEECYRDAQCLGDCDKSWYEVFGSCT